MTYPQTIQYLESFANYEKLAGYPYKESIKLERVKDFLAAIANPQNSLKSLHVAGTKGKGSTSAFIAYILREAGYRVGLYTSPHLTDFRERIRILKPADRQSDFEGMIYKSRLTGLVKKLKPAIEKYNKDSKYGPLSFFEVYTSLAFVYFKEKKVDFAVLETGLGGRLDATNAVDALVSVITPVSYEHTEKLGRTLREIAAEKAGIIKSGLGRTPIVISAPQEKEAAEVIRDKCKETGARLYEVEPPYRNLKIRLLGEHQLINASAAIAAVEALRLYGINIDNPSIRRGLYNTVWPGRCEVVSRSPLTVLDGAQNIASACALKKTITSNFKYKKLILILGISGDKDIEGICRQITPLADTIILTQADNPRAAGVDSIERVIRKPIIKTTNVKEAWHKAKNIAGREDLILVTGSLFVVGEFRDGRIRS